MATLTLADLAAVPTGATATIAGSAGGSNTVYVSQGDPANPATDAGWISGGTRTGDGDVSLTLRPGVYFAYLLTAPAAIAAPVFFRVTDGLDAVPTRCLAAVSSRAQSLSLTCTTRVYDQVFTADPAVLWPHLVVTPAGARQSDERALNGRDDWGHPVRVLIRDKVFKFDQTKRSVFETWKQGVVRAFHNQRLPGIPESIVCRVEHGPHVEPPMGGDGVLSSELTIRCVTREVRGLGA